MGSGGLQYDAGDTGGAARWNQKQLFVGTGAQINGLGTTYAGQMAYCTSTGSGFTLDNLYQRNAANSSWVNLSGTEKTANKGVADGYAGLDHMAFIPPQFVPLFYGLVSSGAVTYSVNTDLGSSNQKSYTSLTVNNSVSLTGNTNMILVVSGTLATNTSGTIHVDGKVAGVTTAGTNATVLFASQANSGGKAGGAGGSAAGGAGGGFGSSGGTSLSNSGGVAVTIPTVPLALWGVAGSGGGGNTVNNGGTAGGMMFIYANAVTGTGTFSSGGGQGQYSGTNGGTGGGSGGLIWLAVATTISGIAINAIGGDASASWTNQGGGGGSGGIIHEYYGTSSSSTRTVTGGANHGGSGTSGNTGIQDSTQI